jgi:tetratricopeptide (TPR) repeat protein
MGAVTIERTSPIRRIAVESALNRQESIMHRHSTPMFIAVGLTLLLGLSPGFLPEKASANNIHDPRAIEANPATATGPIAPKLEGLGSLHLAVTTNVPESQAFFDQGLRLTYAFNHSEALRAFKEAARLDPNNAMAYWGWALVLGPNINLPMQLDVAKQAHQAVELAMSLRKDTTAKERALIEALASRYVAEPKNSRRELDQAYADHMAKLNAQHPGSADIETLTAAALMNLEPWNYWRADGAPRLETTKILALLEAAIKRNGSHPGALHYYIHIVEAAHPERGVAAADALRGLMPGAGHLVHMPSHIYMRVGRYAESFEANRLASEADAGYISQCRAQGIYPLNYYPHNLHFMVWSALFQGRNESALSAARTVASKIPESMGGNAFGSFETWMSQPMYVMVRFGQWNDMLEEPRPAEGAHFMGGVWHYARGLAQIHTKNHKRAKKELKKLRKLRKAIPNSYLIGFSSAPKLLMIAELVLAGELDVAKEHYDEGIAKLDRAVRLQDSLLYNEPPDWYFPVRHVLGAALMEAGRPDEAEVVYWQDLKKNRENGYALLGLSESLAAQGKEEAAAAALARFETAWKDAETTLRTSRF